MPRFYGERTWRMIPDCLKIVVLCFIHAMATRQGRLLLGEGVRLRLCFAAVTLASLESTAGAEIDLEYQETKILKGIDPRLPCPGFNRDALGKEQKKPQWRFQSLDDSGNWADIRNARVYTDGDVYIEEVDVEGIYECFFTIKSNDTTIHSGHRITFREPNPTTLRPEITSTRPRELILHIISGEPEFDKNKHSRSTIRVTKVIEVNGKNQTLKEKAKKVHATYQNVTYTLPSEKGEYTICILKNYTKYVNTSTCVDVPFDELKDITVVNGKGELSDDGIFLTITWEVANALPGEEDLLTYRVKPYEYNPKSKNYEAMATKEVKKDRTLTIADIRQKKHKVEITPLMKATNYTGPTYSFTTNETGDQISVTEPPKGGEPMPIPKSVGSKAGPSNLVLKFRDSFSADLNFVVHKSAKKGCESALCATPELTETCSTKKLKATATTARFEFEADSRYYVSVRCETTEGLISSLWLTFVSPTPEAGKIPQEVRTWGTSIEATLEVDDGLNLELAWSFKFENGSVFPRSLIRGLDVYEYSKRKAQDYSEELLSSGDTGATSLSLGLSPSLTFDVACHFYAINASFLDDSYYFLTSEEYCYSMYSTSYLILYGIIAFFVILAICAIIGSSRSTKKYDAEIAASKGTPSTSSSSLSFQRFKRRKVRGYANRPKRASMPPKLRSPFVVEYM